MLSIMNDLPDNILGVDAEGEITAVDYETILIPALEEKLKANKKIRMLYHLGSSFNGFDKKAMVDDAIMGIKHLSAWERIAIASDHEMINILLYFFGYVLSCQVLAFKNNELEEAKKWITE